MVVAALCPSDPNEAAPLHTVLIRWKSLGRKLRLAETEVTLILYSWDKGPGACGDSLLYKTEEERDR